MGLLCLGHDRLRDVGTVGLPSPSRVFRLSAGCRVGIDERGLTLDPHAVRRGGRLRHVLERPVLVERLGVVDDGVVGETNDSWSRS